VLIRYITAMLVTSEIVNNIGMKKTFLILIKLKK
jgi:hypothetical protein